MRVVELIGFNLLLTQGMERRVNKAARALADSETQYESDERFRHGLSIIILRNQGNVVGKWFAAKTYGCLDSKRLQHCGDYTRHLQNVSLTISKC
jgi:hypothetical protein